MADEEKKAAQEPKADAESPKSKVRRKAKSAGGKGKKDGGVTTKVVATVFGAVVAPILVAVGIKVGLRWFESPPAKETPATKEKESEKVVERPSLLSLLGPDLSKHFYTFTYDEERKENVRNDTVDPSLFRYEERPGRIVVPGENRNGKNRNVLLTTKRDDFENYVLHLWYRWGDPKHTYGEIEGKARKGTLLLHITGPDGGVHPWAVWPQCVTMHLSEGSIGSLRLQGAPKAWECLARVKESPDRLRREYVGGDAKELRQVSGEPEGWDGYLLRRHFPADVRFDAKNFLVGADGEKLPAGYHPDKDPTIVKVSPPYQGNEWNVVRVDCLKDTIRVTINNKLVNEITGLNIRKGKIGINSALAEYEIGKLDVEFLPFDKPEKGPEKNTEKGRP